MSYAPVNNVILFDGICNLCISSVQFIIKHDRKMKFSFASLQGKFGQEVLNKYHLSADTFNSFVLLKDGKLYTRSTAALLMLKQLGGGWKIFYGLMIIPKFIRNWLYNIIARNRYRWFGKRDSCMVPTPDLKDRFLD